MRSTGDAAPRRYAAEVTRCRTNTRRSPQRSARPSKVHAAAAGHSRAAPASRSGAKAARRWTRAKVAASTGGS